MKDIVFLSLEIIVIFFIVLTYYENKGLLNEIGHKVKVGDSVRIKQNLEKYIWCERGMLKYKGLSAVVTEKLQSPSNLINNYTLVRLDIDKGEHVWSLDLLKVANE